MDIQHKASRLQPLGQSVDLNVDDLGQLFTGQSVEHNDVVKAVDEFRLEGGFHGRFHLLLGPTCAQVRGQDQDGVPEVHRAALSIGQAPFVEHLQEDIEDVGVSLLNLVE